VSMSILIAGSGKIGRDTGMYFLKRGNAVTWVSANEARLVELQAWVDKSVRMHLKYSGGAVKRLAASFFLYGELEDDKFDVIVECSKEHLEEKKKVVSRLEKYLNGALLLSTSSSLLPSSIHPACAGFHVFYPLEFTKTAETVVPASLSFLKINALNSLCAENGITPIMQTEKNAFSVNRLLLPLQNEVFRLIENGIAAADINKVSASPLLPIGQLDFIKKIGPAVVRASVENYRFRMRPEEADAFTQLSNGLVDFMGPSVSRQSSKELSPNDLGALKRRLYYLFINTCLDFIEQKEMRAADLDHALDSVFGAEIAFDQAVRDEGKQVISDTLNEVFDKTRIEYFRPRPALSIGGNF